MKWTSCPKWQLEENKMSLKASHVSYGAHMEVAAPLSFWKDKDTNFLGGSIIFMWHSLKLV